VQHPSKHGMDVESKLQTKCINTLSPKPSFNAMHSNFLKSWVWVSRHYLSMHLTGCLLQDQVINIKYKKNFDDHFQNPRWTMQMPQAW
jgi:hypothetical protein